MPDALTTIELRITIIGLAWGGFEGVGRIKGEIERPLTEDEAMAIEGALLHRPSLPALDGVYPAFSFGDYQTVLDVMVEQITTVGVAEAAKTTTTITEELLVDFNDEDSHAALMEAEFGFVFADDD